MAMLVLKIVKKINLVRHMCHHMFGKDHTTVHRCGAGAVVMAFGVWLAHASGHAGVPLVQYAGDLVGYGLHGIGLTPYIEALLESAEAAA